MEESLKDDSSGKPSSASKTHEEMDAIGQEMDENGTIEERNNDSDMPDELEHVDLGHTTTVQPMEISAAESSDDDDDDDLEALLASEEGPSRKKKKKPTKRGATCCGCCQSQRVGNIIMFGERRRIIVGPHWFGPPCVMIILAWASEFFIRKSLHLGPISTAICVIFLVSTVYNLMATAYQDPGVVVGRPPPTNDEDLEDWRWCDFCNTHQPPDGAHCPDCRVCIAGYDHHCVWMGVCIGKGNIKPFMRFNMCWLLYLLYAVLWVSVIGPIVAKKMHWNEE